LRNIDAENFFGRHGVRPTSGTADITVGCSQDNGNASAIDRTTLKSSSKMSKQPFVLTPKNYPRPLKVLSEHAAVLPTYVGIVEL